MTPISDRINDTMRRAIIGTLDSLQPAVIYLFGSYGTPSQHPASDIDLAFLPLTAIDPLACFAASNALADALGFSVDLVDLSRASTVMAKEVLRTGMALHVADLPRRQQFEMQTLADYARLNEERQPVLARQP
jgi:predicted nucleotidyltransferase